jgi:hypothetical protein
MPYKLGKSSSCPASKPFAVLKEGGALVPGGCHATKEGARKHLGALEANVEDARAAELGRAEDVRVRRETIRNL